MDYVLHFRSLLREPLKHVLRRDKWYGEHRESVFTRYVTSTWCLKWKKKIKITLHISAYIDKSPKQAIIGCPPLLLAWMKSQEEIIRGDQRLPPRTFWVKMIIYISAMDSKEAQSSPAYTDNSHPNKGN